MINRYGTVIATIIVWVFVVASIVFVVVIVRHLPMNGSGASESGMTTAAPAQATSGPGEVMHKMLETYDSGDKESAKQYLTEHGKTVQIQIAWYHLDGVLGVWGSLSSGGLFPPGSYEAGFDQVTITGNTARVPLMFKGQKVDGSFSKTYEKFKFLDRSGYCNFVLVLQNGQWLVDDFEW